MECQFINRIDISIRKKGNRNTILLKIKFVQDDQDYDINRDEILKLIF